MTYTVESVRFTSHDAVAGDIELVGILYAGQDAGPHPTAILLHGAPGAEKNTDLAYRLRDLNWNVLIVHFRGSWGSSGDYNLATQPDDTLAALDFMLAS